MHTPLPARSAPRTLVLLAAVASLAFGPAAVAHAGAPTPATPATPGPTAAGRTSAGPAGASPTDYSSQALNLLKLDRQLLQEQFEHQATGRPLHDLNSYRPRDGVSATQVERTVDAIDQTQAAIDDLEHVVADLQALPRTSDPATPPPSPTSSLPSSGTSSGTSSLPSSASKGAGPSTDAAAAVVATVGGAGLTTAAAAGGAAAGGAAAGSTAAAVGIPAVTTTAASVTASALATSAGTAFGGGLGASVSTKMTADSAVATQWAVGGGLGVVGAVALGGATGALAFHQTEPECAQDAKPLRQLLDIKVLAKVIVDLDGADIDTWKASKAALVDIDKYRDGAADSLNRFTSSRGGPPSADAAVWKAIIETLHHPSRAPQELSGKWSSKVYEKKFDEPVGTLLDGRPAMALRVTVWKDKTICSAFPVEGGDPPPARNDAHPQESTSPAR